MTQRSLRLGLVGIALLVGIGGLIVCTIKNPEIAPSAIGIVVVLLIIGAGAICIDQLGR